MRSSKETKNKRGGSMTRPVKTPRELAREHWIWIDDMLTDRHQETKHMFIEGFVHGFKHGKEKKCKS